MLEQRGLFPEELTPAPPKKAVQMAQPKREDAAIPNNPPQKDLRKETEAWIQSNPDVAKLFLYFARELASKRRPFGIGLIAERVRYECAMTTSPSKFKVNNNARSYIARWLIAQDPSLEQWMSFRKVKY
jgi:hypothetical protein